jgi:hypothetical protein
MDLGPHGGPDFADQPLTRLGPDFKGIGEHEFSPDLVREVSLNSQHTDQ